MYVNHLKQWLEYIRKKPSNQKYYLEKLQQAPTSDFVSIYFLFSQMIWMQQFRNQNLQLVSELWGHI